MSSHVQCLTIATLFSLLAGKLMSAVLSGLSDRNITIRKAYAVAIGHLVRVSFYGTKCYVTLNAK